MRWNLANTVLAILLVLLSACVVDADGVDAPAANFGRDSELYSANNCAGDCGFVCVCQPETCYSASANFLWLGRSRTEDNALIGVPANLPIVSLLRAGDMEFEVSPGVDVGFRAKRPSGRSWELRYFGIYDQAARERRTYDDGDADPTNDATIVHLGVYHGSYTDLTTIYSSDLHSGEVNLWLNPWWCFEPLVGFRWVRQSEELESFVTTDFGEGALIDIANDMYGGQLGVRSVLWEIPARCRIEATLKGGVFSNDIRLAGETRTTGVTTLTPSSSLTTTAYAGEWTVSAVYQFTPFFSARIGYNGLWLDGVGLAADQLDESFFAPGTTDLTTLIYQGGHLGFEYGW